MITTILAQAAAPAVDPEFFWKFLGSVGFIMSLLINAGVFWNMRKTQKREVRFETEFVSRSEISNLGNRIDRLEVAIEKVRIDMKEDRASIDRVGEDRISKVHERINDVLEAVSELRGQLRRGA